MILGLGTVTTILVLVVGTTLLSLPLAAIWDARAFTVGQWQQAGHDRGRWVLAMGLGALAFVVPGAIVAVEYLRTIRPKLVAAPG